MDIVDVTNACGIAGIPKEVVDEIWIKKSDEDFMTNYIAWKKAGN